MLHAGIHLMWVRYPIAVSLSYLTFLAGVWLWLRYMGLGRRVPAVQSVVDSAGLPDISSGGTGSSGGISLPEGIGKGGGQFAGAGAGGSWDGAGQTQMMAAIASPSDGSSASGAGSSGGGGGGGGLDIDGDGLVVLILAALLICSIFLLSGYIIYMAPDILSEAVFGASLAGGLARHAQGHANEGWAESVVKKTWWPFAIVLGLSLGFAIYCAIHFPDASTLREAIFTVVD
jgi:hypothetical protein